MQASPNIRHCHRYNVLGSCTFFRIETDLTLELTDRSVWVRSSRPSKAHPLFGNLRARIRSVLGMTDAQPSRLTLGCIHSTCAARKITRQIQSPFHRRRVRKNSRSFNASRPHSGQRISGDSDMSYQHFGQRRRPRDRSAKIARYITHNPMIPRMIPEPQNVQSTSMTELYAMLPRRGNV